MVSFNLAILSPSLSLLLSPSLICFLLVLLTMLQALEVLQPTLQPSWVGEFCWTFPGAN